MGEISLSVRIGEELDIFAPKVNDYFHRTERHQLRVCAISTYIAAAMNLPERKLNALQIAARYHDYAKRLWSDRMATLPKEELTPYERNLINCHPINSCKLIENDLAYHPDLIESMKKEGILEIIYHHHIDKDGNGYPPKKIRRTIPAESHILRVADALDAIISNRKYRSKKNRRNNYDTAMIIIDNNTGTEFDPLVVAALHEVPDYKIKELYAHVNLRSN